MECEIHAFYLVAYLVSYEVIMIVHCAVRLVSMVHLTTTRSIIYRKIANFVYNPNPLTKMRNGLSHTLYQIKKYKNCQIYDLFGIFGIIPENIANNKSGTLMLNGVY